MAVAWLLSPSRSPGYRGDEGVRWYAAVVAHFKKYEGRGFRVMRSSAPEQIGLNFIMGRYMLRIKSEERQSAVDCLERGEFLWYRVSGGGSKTPHERTRQDRYLTFRAPKIYEVETEIAGGRTPNSDEWLSLTRAFPMNGVNVEGSGVDSMACGTLYISSAVQLG